jgi:hypothetical protein
MLWLRNKDNGNIYPVLEQSPEMSYLRAQRSVVDGRPLFEELGIQEVQADVPSEPFASFVIAKYVGAVTTAGDNQNTSLGLSPADGTLTACVAIVAAAVSGVATNYRTISMFDDGTPANAGAAYAQVNPASMASTAFSATTTTWTPGQENPLTLGTTTVNANDILRVGSVASGTGLTFGDFVLLATFSRKV